MADIVVAEDDANIRLVLATQLRMLKHRPHLAANGLEALRLVAEVRPALIMLDGVMPEMDGFEACRQLRRAGDLGGAKVLLLTALDDLTADQSADFDAVLGKPFHAEDLARVVGELLAAHLESSVAPTTESA